MKRLPLLTVCKAKQNRCARAVAPIYYEIIAAQEKWPDWPCDIVHAAAVASDECGKFLHAVMKYNYRHGAIEDVRKEAVQAAATIVRFIANLDADMESTSK